MKIDSKGRISIPSEIRKNFGLEEGFEIELLFDLKKNFVVLVFGQDGVTVSTVDCGSASPGSNTAFPRASTSSKAVEQKGNPVENPGPGPGNNKRGGFK